MRFTVVCFFGLITTVFVACTGSKDPQAPAGDPHFTYIPSEESGVNFSNILSSSDYFNINEHPGFFDGANVAVGDINKDGLTDLYFVSNQWDNKLYLNKGDLTFEDITTKAGVTGAGNWKTTAVLKDADNDGDIDIYVRGAKGNRYVNTDDQLFLNNGDLTFSRSLELFGLDSLEISPGKAEADINNDGLKDIVTVGESNTMQINEGSGLYTDIAWYAGVAATDKSWTPLIADFDGDGLNDLFITNGIVSRADPNDSTKLVDGAAPNFIFKQGAGLKFKDMTEAWIRKTPGISNGAALADLDNDGDMDIVVNNIGVEAFIMRNDLSGEERKTTKASYSPVDPFLQPTKPLSFKHNENSFNTLTKQPLIPFTNATRGPRMAIADINGDKIEDLFITGGQGQPGVIFIQTKAGKFVQVPQPAFEADKHCEETCAAFFDADGDRDMDLLVGSGGEEFLDKRLLLRLYINNGRGTFTKRQDGLKRADIVSSLQKIYVNASCLVPADVDNDGDMDVFVGGGTVTGRYGVDSDSFILLNDGKGMLTESATTFENRQRPGGMVQAAAWVDMDGDKYPELVTAGEWMTVSVWKNDSSVLKRVTGNGLDSTYGLWNSLLVDDLDADGDKDIIAGNFGLNGSMRGSNKEPFELVTSQKIPRRFVTTLESTLFENQGGNKFVTKPLPGPAQYFPVFGINVTDVDNDGKKDIILVGNLRAVQPGSGNFNAGYGLILSGGTKAVPLRSSGFIIKGEGRDVKSLVTVNKEKLFLVTRNNDSLVVFKRAVK